MSCSLNGCKDPSGAGEVTASMVRKLLFKSPSEDTALALLLLETEEFLLGI